MFLGQSETSKKECEKMKRESRCGNLKRKKIWTLWFIYFLSCFRILLLLQPETLVPSRHYALSQVAEPLFAKSELCTRLTSSLSLISPSTSNPTLLLLQMESYRVCLAAPTWFQFDLSFKFHFFLRSDLRFRTFRFFGLNNILI